MAPAGRSMERWRMNRMRRFARGCPVRVPRVPRVALLLCAALAGVLGSLDATPSDSPLQATLAQVSRQCEIEEWRSEVIGLFIVINGFASCSLGAVSILLYEGEGAERRFLSAAQGHIQNHVFTIRGNTRGVPADMISVEFRANPLF